MTSLQSLAKLGASVVTTTAPLTPATTLTQSYDGSTEEGKRSRVSSLVNAKLRDTVLCGRDVLTEPVIAIPLANEVPKSTRHLLKCGV